MRGGLDKFGGSMGRSSDSGSDNTRLSSIRGRGISTCSSSHNVLLNYTGARSRSSIKQTISVEPLVSSNSLEYGMLAFGGSRGSLSRLTHE